MPWKYNISLKSSSHQATIQLVQAINTLAPSFWFKTQGPVLDVQKLFSPRYEVKLNRTRSDKKCFENLLVLLNQIQATSCKFLGDSTAECKFITSMLSSDNQKQTNRPVSVWGLNRVEHSDPKLFIHSIKGNEPLWRRWGGFHKADHIICLYGLCLCSVFPWRPPQFPLLPSQIPPDGWSETEGLSTSKSKDLVMLFCHVAISLFG